MGTEPDAMSRSFERLFGRPPPPRLLGGAGLVGTTRDGVVVMSLFQPDERRIARDLDRGSTSYSELLAHEYYHVLQHDLGQGAARGAWWLVEGMAEYFSELIYPPYKPSPDDPTPLAKEMGGRVPVASHGPMSPPRNWPG